MQIRLRSIGLKYQGYLDSNFTRRIQNRVSQAKGRRIVCHMEHFRFMFVIPRFSSLLKVGLRDWPNLEVHKGDRVSPWISPYFTRTRMLSRLTSLRGSSRILTGAPKKPPLKIGLTRNIMADVPRRSEAETGMCTDSIATHQACSSSRRTPLRMNSCARHFTIGK